MINATAERLKELDWGGSTSLVLIAIRALDAITLLNALEDAGFGHAAIARMCDEEAKRLRSANDGRIGCAQRLEGTARIARERRNMRKGRNAATAAA